MPSCPLDPVEPLGQVLLSQMEMKNMQKELPLPLPPPLLCCRIKELRGGILGLFLFL